MKPATPIALLRALKQAVTSDEHAREVLRGSTNAFLLKILGTGLAFMLSVAVARLLGASGAGLYFLSLSVVTIGAEWLRCRRLA